MILGEAKRRPRASEARRREASETRKGGNGHRSAAKGRSGGVAPATTRTALLGAFQGHITKDIPMTKDQQAELLRRLNEDFGMSIDGAQGLSGGALDSWLERAEDACMWVVQTWTPEENQRRPSSWSPFP